MYFEIQFSDPIAEIVYEQKPGGSNTTSADLSKSYQAIIRFKNVPAERGKAASNVLQVRCALSMVDEEGAPMQAGMAALTIDEILVCLKKLRKSSNLFNL